MRKNHVPASCSLTALVVFLIVAPKKHDTFTAKEILLALGFAVMIYIYATIFDLGEGNQ